MGDIFADGGVSSYPTDLDTRTEQANATPTLVFDNTTAHASKVNELADAVIAVQTKVGTTATTGTAGSVIFADGTNFAQDNANLFWDNAGNLLGIGTAAPVSKLTVQQSGNTTPATPSTYGSILFDGTNAVLAFGYDASISYIQSFASHVLHINNQGNDVIFSGANSIGLGTATVASSKVIIGGTHTASGTLGVIYDVRGTVTGNANGDILAAGNFGLTTFAKGTLTGLLAFGMRIVPSNLGVTGSGTIDNCAGIYISDNPTIGTNNYAIWLDSGTFRWDDPIALGGGAAPTLGTIGGSGPATAGQNQWLRVNINGTSNFIPVWQ